MSSRRALITLAALAACAVLMPSSAESVLPGDANEAEINSRGFDPSKVYGSFDIDHVDLFSGSLRITIPIGQEYPVNGTLSYGFSLVYSSSVFTYHTVQESREGEMIDVPEAVPNPLSNAGLGWMVTFGKLIPPGTDVVNEDTTHWLYVSSDGGQHLLYDTLHVGETSVSGVWYTRDNSYLRMKGDQINGPLEIESPDGLIHKLELLGTEWEVTQIRDRFSNEVLIDRSTADDWKITDLHGREHHIHFQPGTTDLPTQQIDRIVLDTFDDTTSTWQFSYTNKPIDRGCRNDALNSSPTVFVPLLVELGLPEGLTYSFEDDAGIPLYEDNCTTSFASGQITGARLPAQGQILWDWTTFYMPRERIEGGPPGSTRAYSPVPGISARTLTDAEGTPLGQWIYDNGIEGVDLGCNPQCVDAEKTWTVMVSPITGCSKHSFTTTQAAQSGLRWAYGLPFDHAIASDGRYLSTQTWTEYEETEETFPFLLQIDCSGTQLRQSWVEFDHDTLSDEVGDPVDDGRHQQNSNRRLKRSRTIYVDDDNRYADTVSSDFDGLGHYRTTMTGGNFTEDDERISFTGFNPATNGTYPSYPGDDTTPGTAEPWLLNLYDKTTVTQGTELATALYDFDPVDGFLNCTRLATNDDSEWTAIYTADDERLAAFDAGGSFLQERWALRNLDGRVLTQYLYNVTTGELLFSDGFESGDTCAWSDTVGGPVCQMASLTSAAWYWARDYIYRNGQLLAEIDGGEVLYLHLDHLGSLRQVTDSERRIVEDHDFLPFGEEITDLTVETLLFTGHERDSHTDQFVDDLDYMHARYYSPWQGRFLSVDPIASAVSAMPQSWNRYTYALNSPTNYVDPDGLTVVGFTGLGNDRAGGVTGALNALVSDTALLGQVAHFRWQDVNQAVQMIRMRESSKNPGATLAIFGHSLGALASLNAARVLQGVESRRVDLLLTIDPPSRGTGQHMVPENVDTAINFYQSKGAIGGSLLRAEDPRRTTVHNIEVGVGHGTIDEEVMQSVVHYVRDQARTGDLELNKGLQFIQGVLVRIR